MAAELYWFYDALVLGIFLIFLFVGAKRGLLKSVVTVLLTVLVIVASWFGSEIASPIIYDRFIKEPLSNALSQSSNDLDPAKTAHDAIAEGDYGVEMDESEIETIIQSDGDFFSNLVSELKNNGASEDAEKINGEVQEAVVTKMLSGLLAGMVAPETLTEILSSVEGTTDGITKVVDVFLFGNSEETAKAFEENVLGPVIKGILKAIVFVLLLLLLKLITGPIAGLFKNVNKVPIIGPVNVILGGALGAVEALVVIAVICLTVKLAVYFTEGSLMFINEETIANTHLFRYFYNFDLTRF